MFGYDHATILVPVSTSPQGTPGTMIPHLCIKYDEKQRGILSEKLGGGVRHASWNSYPTISDQNLWFSLPYFRPEALEPGAWPEHVTSCYDTYTVGVNIKREMVLSPNGEEVANIPNSRLQCTKHTLFQTKIVEIDTLFQTKKAKKPYPLAPRIPIQPI